MDKQDVYIWGTGKGEQNLSIYLDTDKVNILGYIDIDVDKQKKGYKGLKVISPKRIGKKFDFIILSMVQFGEPKNQLIEMGISSEKIVAFYSDDISVPDNHSLFNDRICHWENNLIRRQLNGCQKQIDALKAENRRLSIRISSLEQKVRNGKERLYSPEDEAVARVKLSVGNFIVNGDSILTEMVKDRIVCQKWNIVEEDDTRDLIQRIQKLEEVIFNG